MRSVPACLLPLLCLSVDLATMVRALLPSPRKQPWPFQSKCIVSQVLSSSNSRSVNRIDGMQHVPCSASAVKQLQKLWGPGP